jgi:peptide-methionine (S)-S-oxide reductase
MQVLIRAAVAVVMIVMTQAASAATATFAGGCFWCMESAYQDVPGVTAVVSGFTGGSHPNPSYSGSHTGHYEAVLVSYEPDQISYQQLLDLYWRNVDPFDAGGQFCDRGESYRAAIFVADAQEESQALATRDAVMEKFSGQKVVTEVLPASKFFPVEEAHQDYYQKNPLRYKYYRYGCGRDKRLEEIWGSAPH